MAMITAAPPARERRSALDILVADAHLVAVAQAGLADDDDAFSRVQALADFDESFGIGAGLDLALAREPGAIDDHDGGGVLTPRDQRHAANVTSARCSG